MRASRVRVKVPVLEQGPMFNAINFDFSGESAFNLTVSTQRVALFVCPSEVDPSPVAGESGVVGTYGFLMGDWLVWVWDSSGYAVFRMLWPYD